jgi:hypothetical protein
MVFEGKDRFFPSKPPRRMEMCWAWGLTSFLGEGRVVGRIGFKIEDGFLEILSKLG